MLETSGGLTKEFGRNKYEVTSRGGKGHEVMKRQLLARGAAAPRVGGLGQRGGEGRRQAEEGGDQRRGEVSVRLTPARSASKGDEETRMATVQRATLDNLYRTPGKAELIGGRIVEYMATGVRPSEVASNIYRQPAAARPTDQARQMLYRRPRLCRPGTAFRPRVLLPGRFLLRRPTACQSDALR